MVETANLLMDKQNQQYVGYYYLGYVLAERAINKANLSTKKEILGLIINFNSPTTYITLQQVMW